MKNLFGPRFRLLHWGTDQIMNDALAQMDLTASQGRIMGYLARQSAPPCAHDIEAHFHLSHPSVSGTLSRMEKKGFIETRADDHDHRCKRIYILPKGLECHERMMQVIRDIEQQITKDFAESDRAQFSALLNRAIQNMGIHYCPTKKEE